MYRFLRCSSKCLILQQYFYLKTCCKFYKVIIFPTIFTFVSELPFPSKTDLLLGVLPLLPESKVQLLHIPSFRGQRQIPHLQSQSLQHPSAREYPEEKERLIITVLQFRGHMWLVVISCIWQNRNICGLQKHLNHNNKTSSISFWKFSWKNSSRQSVLKAFFFYEEHIKATYVDCA